MGRTDRAGRKTSQDFLIDQRTDLARALKTVLLKYDGLWQRPFPYIMAWYQAPTDGAGTSRSVICMHEFYPPYRSRDKLEVSWREPRSRPVSMQWMHSPKTRRANCSRCECLFSREARSKCIRRVARPSIGQAPGRVNLLGEHTDYNDGYVLPIAIPQQTRVAIRRSASDAFTVYAADARSNVRVHAAIAPAIGRLCDVRIRLRCRGHAPQASTSRRLICTCRLRLCRWAADFRRAPHSKSPRCERLRELLQSAHG